jgi:hypothetical protein
MIKPAKGLVKAFLDIVGSDGGTLPPFGIYIRERCLADDRLCRHERAHWAQWQRMGTVKFFVVYLWLLARHGYDEHPMELEARQAEQERPLGL